LSNIEKLIGVMAQLRDPQQGCPWDLEQSFETIVPHTLEEAYEVAETIETGDISELCGELGDLLFQVVFYARMAEEQNLFDFAQVVDGIVGKLVRRHPHVFGDEDIADVEAQNLAWESHKAQERAEKTENASALAGVANALPALTRAVKLQKRAAQVGFDWPTIEPVYEKVIEELDEVKQEITGEITFESSSEANLEISPQTSLERKRQRIEEEVGDLLFACTNLARHAQINPETALRRSNRKFEKRFAGMETIAAENSITLSELDIEKWEALWEQVKAEENTRK
jgi:ATP diphosphatase